MDGTSEWRERKRERERECACAYVCARARECEGERERVGSQSGLIVGANTQAKVSRVGSVDIQGYASSRRPADVREREMRSSLARRSSTGDRRESRERTSEKTGSCVNSTLCAHPKFYVTPERVCDFHVVRGKKTTLRMTTR